MTMTEILKIPEAKGYIFFDPKKCTACKSCMLACSLVHEGKLNLSLSRIQILGDPFGQYPTDITIAVCKQCKYPLCVEACNIGAIKADKEYLNVRMINEQECIGCKLCISACPFIPSMIVWNIKKQKASKCDLCKDAPFWSEKGKQACIEVCPTRALKFSIETPRVSGYKGYIVNLRGEGWKQLGLPVD